MPRHHSRYWGQKIWKNTKPLEVFFTQKQPVLGVFYSSFHLGLKRYLFICVFCFFLNTHFCNYICKSGASSLLPVILYPAFLSRRLVAEQRCVDGSGPSPTCSLLPPLPSLPSFLWLFLAPTGPSLLPSAVCDVQALVTTSTSASPYKPGILCPDRDQALSRVLWPLVPINRTPPPCPAGSGMGQAFSSLSTASNPHPPHMNPCRLLPLPSPASAAHLIAVHCQLATLACHPAPKALAPPISQPFPPAVVLCPRDYDAPVRAPCPHHPGLCS